MKLFFPFLVLTILIVTSCKSNTSTTFKEDIELLNVVEDLTILKNENSMIAVSGAYQGRVFTSSTQGLSGRSLGYFNRELIKKGNSKNNLSKLGGESRMWFGPEIGKYAIFFDPGTEQNANTIKISPELNTKLFTKVAGDEKSVIYYSKMNIRNANNYHFAITAVRHISIKDRSEIMKDLNIDIAENISQVGFCAQTLMINKGKEKWSKENGLLSIWDISCITPSPNTTVIIPTSTPIDSATIYFTPIESDRIKIKNQTIFYKADAQYMNKIGIQPKYCTDIFGSYSPELNLLTIVKYSFNNDSLYVNSHWGHQDPYKGDVINVFNGEVNPNLDRNWDFYELETSSSSKELEPDERISHAHNVYHFEGDEKYLNEIAEKVLGTSIVDIHTIFD